ncbi:MULTISPECIES: hypothetical protein [Bradyrhizobium]|uniref:hypothetical protein n=1 Tax=Bradyrhizobium TaxID=374 RepID=UPI0004B02CCD|nr:MULTISPECIES: hypothetical protein [Bradyrhizobium]MDI2077077.1 hypothetical protein [Bradyrhizobium sp. Mp27]
MSISTLKPSGMRGVSPSAGQLQVEQGMPAPPQLQARAPSQPKCESAPSRTRM